MSLFASLKKSHAALTFAVRQVACQQSRWSSRRQSLPWSKFPMPTTWCICKSRSIWVNFVGAFWFEGDLWNLKNSGNMRMLLSSLSSWSFQIPQQLETAPKSRRFIKMHRLLQQTCESHGCWEICLGCRLSSFNARTVALHLRGKIHWNWGHDQAEGKELKANLIKRKTRWIPFSCYENPVSFHRNPVS